MNSGAHAVLGVGHAVLGHVERLPVPGETDEEALEATRVDLAILEGRRPGAIGTHVTRAGEEHAGRRAVEGQGVAAVVVHADVVAAVPGPGMAPEAQSVGRLQAPRHDRLDEPPVEGGVADRGHEAIAPRGWIRGLEAGEVLHEAHTGVGLHRLDRSIGRGVGAQLVAGDPDEGQDARLSRPAAQDVGKSRVDPRLVEGGPGVAQVAEDRNDVSRVAGEGRHHFGDEPAPALRQPARVREVVESDHGGQASLPQRLQHLAIAAEGRRVPPSRLGLDPAPLDGQAKGGEPQLGGAVEVFLGAVPPVAGHAAHRSVGGVVARLLPGPEVVVDVHPLVLVGSRGRAPEEAVGETEDPLAQGSTSRRTRPVPGPMRPMAWAAARETSITRPLWLGKRSLMRTTQLFPVESRVTRTRVPKAQSKWAAVRAS